jgi:hypothetical protein
MNLTSLMFNETLNTRSFLIKDDRPSYANTPSVVPAIVALFSWQSLHFGQQLQSV